MAHAHLIVKHLLKQIETAADQRKDRKIRPEWLTGLIEDVALLFEPLAGVARVGCECQLHEDCWEVRMYLGATEIVGGLHDGRALHASFQFDLSALLERFTTVDSCSWTTFTGEAESEQAAGRSFLTVQGWLGENPMRLKVYSHSPRELGPALRRHPDGRHEPV